MKWIIIFLIFLIPQFAFGDVIITGQKIIDHDMVYDHQVIDLSRGSFLVKNHAVLTIQNSVVKGTVSKNNNSLISVMNGRLIFKNNVMYVETSLPKIPSNPALYYVIMVNQGDIEIAFNRFKIDKSHTVGLLSSNETLNSFQINNNYIYNFHGGLVLQNAHDGLINKNTFLNVSNSNILIQKCTHFVVQSNRHFFSGNNNIGDAIDIFDSRDVLLIDNGLLSGSCYGIVIADSQNVTLQNNRIVGGITYAIYLAPMNTLDKMKIPLLGLLQNKKDFLPNQNIKVINNYLSQNRFGLGAKNVNGLVVKDNIFMQHFDDDSSRKFWTNNAILLTEIKDLVWENNLYKESYVQDGPHDDKRSSRFVIFPKQGGVNL